MKSKTARSLLILSVVILLAAGLSWAGSWGGATLGNIPVFTICIVLALLVQWVAFVPAYKYQTEHYYDLTGTTTYLLVIICAFFLPQEQGTRSTVLLALIAIWTIRLGSFLFIRIRKDGSDSRFDAIKPKPWRFLVAWTIQGLWVSVTCASALAAMTSGRDVPIGWLGIAGIGTWLLGFIIEVISDHQKRVFRAVQKGEKSFIQTGLWAYSRHPNYFGEIVLWIGISMIAWPALSGWQYITMISPLFVIFLLTRVSGIPMLEASADKRWHNNPEYLKYKENTPVLIPRLRKPRSANN